MAFYPEFFPSSPVDNRSHPAACDDITILEGKES